MRNDIIMSVLNDNYSAEFNAVEFIREGGTTTCSAYSGNDKYFLKIVGGAFADTIKASADITAFLMSRGFPVPEIIADRDGSLTAEVELDGKAYFLLLYKYTDLTEIDMDNDAEEVGAAIGRLHSLMSEYDGRLAVHEKRFFVGRYIEILEKKDYPKADEFREYGDMLWKKTEKLTRGYSHGDMYNGNIQRGEDGRLYILDFDTSCRGFPVYDLALACNRTDYFRYDDGRLAETDAVYRRALRGYEKYVNISEPDRASVFDMIALYHFALQATIIEIYGMDCVDYAFFDRQLDWLKRWREQTDIFCVRT